MNRFGNEFVTSEDDFASMDLNKALHDFVHAKLFAEGGGNFKGFIKLQSLVDGLLLYNKQKGYKNQNEFVNKVMKEKFLNAGTRNNKTQSELILDAFVKGNMIYILGVQGLLKGKGLYAAWNIVAGKYHTIKNEGGRAFINGEKRYFGLDKNNLNMKKAQTVLKNLNFSDYNVYDDVSMDTETGIGKIFSDIALMPMIQSENWIQGANMLGVLSQEQWDKFDENGNYKQGVEKVSVDEVLELENKVKLSQGKGYSATDQRMMQTYAAGNAFMQFARFIPTMYHDRFSKSNIDIYGNKHEGSLRKVFGVTSKMLSGGISPRQFAEYRRNLSKEDRRILDSGLRGIAATTFASFMAVGLGTHMFDEFIGDSNYVFNIDKLEYKVIPSVARTALNVVN